jgi:hypothetical protein
MSPELDQVRRAEARWAELAAQTRDRLWAIRNDSPVASAPDALAALAEELDIAVRTVPWWRA